MAFDYAITDVDWSLNDYLYEDYLDKMNANDKYLQQNLSYESLVNDSTFIQVDGIYLSTVSHDFRVKVNGVVKWTKTSYNQDTTHDTFLSVNIPVDSETRGIATILVEKADGTMIGVYKVVLNQETDFLSIWITTQLFKIMFGEDIGSDYHHGVKHIISVIGHNTSEAW